MSASGLSPVRLARMRTVLGGHVDRGEVPGLVALVSRRGDTHVEVLGTTEADGAGAPMRRDTIFRIASISKQITAVAAMTLVEECRIRLDDPVDDLLPELANRQVLRRLDGPLDDTVPAVRPITVRDLLTFRMGLGAIMAPGEHPIQRAMDEGALSPGPLAARRPIEPDEWMKRLGALPLACQPGEQWMYHTGSDALGVLMARVSGQPLGEVLRERVLEPLGMADTAFHVPVEKRDRLPAAYRPDPEAGLVLDDDPRQSVWADPPAFASGGGGLLSTADDLLAFCTMLLGKGRAGAGRILSRPAVEVMTTDQLTERQKADNAVFFDGNSGWGLGFHVITRRTDLPGSPGRFGWTGGTGVCVYTDPAEQLIGVLLTQVQMISPAQPAVFRDFWTCAYQAIDD